MQKFYDTNALLLLQDEVFKEKFFIAYETLRELENIKTSRNKDENVKYRARHMSHLLKENPDRYEAVGLSSEGWNFLVDSTMGNFNSDDIIVTCAASLMDEEDIVFVTDDVCCFNIARDQYGINTLPVFETEDDYTGYLHVQLNEEDMAYFYEHMDINQFDLLINEYLIIEDIHGEIVDKYCWDGDTHRPISFKNIKSDYFGAVRPYNGDIYQQLALDCLSNHHLVMLKGKAGTGKSYLALGYLFHLLDKHKIDKIIVFANPVATIGAAKQGFLPGSRDEKLRDSVIGNMLAAKVGGTFALEELMARDKIVLLPMSDIRGYDTTNMNAGVYITEAQNLDINLMKIALQRIGEDSICIVEGDYNAQVDMDMYAGHNNGMRRMSEVYRGQDFYSEVELKNIYRSRIAEIAERM